MKTLITVYSSNNSANGLERVYHLFCLFFLLIFILFKLFIASLWLGVTFRVVKTMLYIYVLHRILGLFATLQLEQTIVVHATTILKMAQH